MRDIFSAEGKRVLGQFASGNTLVGFDYDGTLTPIVAEPSEALLPAPTRALLARVGAVYPTAIVSGRARSDVMRFVSGLPLLRIVGNHGMEDDPPPRTSPVVRRWMRTVAERVGGVPGVQIEDKTWSIAVHYRHARRRAQVRAEILAAVEDLRDARVVHGKLVVNVVQADAANKGVAIRDICRQLCCDSAIYVGDDVTDEDVFALDPGRLLSVRIGRSTRSKARWYVPRQTDIDAFLQLLLSAR